jgi:glycosyltransferase involved in cell wall biosynthesis
VIPAGVTIAIPNWNHELLLPRSIASALAAVADLASRGVAAEALVIDDESRDGSRPLLRQLEALHYGRGLRVLALKKNGGLGPARNQALAHARYRHVVFMDADNELIPGNVHVFYRAALDTEAAGVYGNLLVRSVTSQSAVTAYNIESFQTPIFQGNYIDAFAMVDRQQLLDLGGYNSAVPAYEDYEQWLHLAVNGRKIVFVPVVLGFYYLLPDSMITPYAEDAKIKAAYAKIYRIYNQVRARAYLPLPTAMSRYHPDVGEL